jgi:hypothetical protein
MRSTYYKNKESGFGKGDQMNGAKTVRDKKSNNEFKKKDKEQKEGDDFLDEMAGEVLDGMNEKHTQQKAGEDKSKEEKEEDSDDGDAFLNDMAGVGLGGMTNTRPTNKREAPRERNAEGDEAKEETNNIVRTIESRENN